MIAKFESALNVTFLVQLATLGLIGGEYLYLIPHVPMSIKLTFEYLLHTANLALFKLIDML